MIVVFGVGSIGRRHIANLITLGVAPESIGVVDADDAAEDRAVADFGVVLFEPKNGQEVQAVLICTPAREHAKQIKACIADGIPFFVEKPATMGVDELTSEEWATSVPHLVGCNLLFRPEVETLRDLESGGVFCSVEAMMNDWPGASYASDLWECCHEIGLAIDLCGPARLAGASSDGQWTLDLEHEGGATSTVVINGYAGRRERRWSLRRPNGAVVNESFDESIDVNQMYLDEMTHFLDVVMHGAPSRHPLSVARNVVEICEAAESEVRS